MKIRTDFVTNSSSSSFLLARKGTGEISQEGKDKIAEILINEYLEDLAGISGVTVENISEHDHFDFRNESIINASKTALSDGFELVMGHLSYEEAEYTLASLLKDMMKILEEEENYRIIDGDLRY